MTVDKDIAVTKEYKLDAETVLRFEVEGKTKVFLELKGGLAEIFGTELVKNKKYTFSYGAKIAVFTWHGCILELSDRTEVLYISKNTPMVTYANIHGYLEQVREKAEAEESNGPVTLICGPSSVGKSTLCRILLNYAVRAGRRPVFVDLNVGQGQLSVPGTVGALLVKQTSDIEEGFSQQAPVVYYYGHTSPSNIILYKLLILRLAEVVVNMQTEGNRRTSVSGMFINTCGWVNGAGHKSVIKHAVSMFEVDVVLVIDQERLYTELLHDLPGFVKIVLIPKSGGVVYRSQENRAEICNNRIHEYFYGLKMPFYPYAFNVNFSDVKVYKIGAPSLSDSCVPFRMRMHIDNQTKLVPVEIGQNLRYVLSISFARTVEGIVRANIAGFICVTDVDMEKQVLVVLSPQPWPLPNAFLLMGDLQFVDT